MEREIKFRGKRKDGQGWICGWLKQTGHQEIQKKNGQYIKAEKYYQIQDDKYNSQFVEEKTVGQFTGLYDKNGKEIYEGDIIKIYAHNFDFGYKQEEIRQIKFKDGSFGIYKEISKKEYYFNDLASEVGYGEIDYYEVIGNIYDNKNLLKEK